MQIIKQEREGTPGQLSDVIFTAITEEPNKNDIQDGFSFLVPIPGKYQNANHPGLILFKSHYR